jgi:hypothetical protein
LDELWLPVHHILELLSAVVEEVVEEEEVFFELSVSE